MTKFYGFYKQVAGTLDGDLITTPHGSLLTLVNDELHHDAAGHVGFLRHNAITNLRGEIQAATDANWNQE